MVTMHQAAATDPAFPAPTRVSRSRTADRTANDESAPAARQLSGTAVQFQTSPIPFSGQVASRAGFLNSVEVTPCLPELNSTSDNIIAVRHSADFNADGIMDQVIQRLGAPSSFSLVWGRPLLPLQARDVVQTCVNANSSAASVFAEAPHSATRHCPAAGNDQQWLLDATFPGLFSSIHLPGAASPHLVFASSNDTSGSVTAVHLAMPAAPLAQAVSNVRMPASRFAACAAGEGTSTIIMPDPTQTTSPNSTLRLFGPLTSLTALDANGDGGADIVFGFELATRSVALEGLIVIFHASLPNALAWLKSHPEGATLEAAIAAGYTTILTGNEPGTTIGGRPEDTAEGIGANIATMQAAGDNSTQMLIFTEWPLLVGGQPQVTSRGQLLMLNASALQPGWSGNVSELLLSTFRVDADGQYTFEGMVVADMNADGSDDFAVLFGGMDASSVIGVVWGNGPNTTSSFWSSPTAMVVMDDFPGYTSDTVARDAGHQPASSLIDVGFGAYSIALGDVDLNGRQDLVAASVIPMPMSNIDGTQGNQAN